MERPEILAVPPLITTGTVNRDLNINNRAVVGWRVTNYPLIGVKDDQEDGLGVSTGSRQKGI